MTCNDDSVPALRTDRLIGLLQPTEGQLSLFGQTAHAAAAARLAQVSYVAQDHPLYRDFSVADMFHLGRAVNPGWDQLAGPADDLIDAHRLLTVPRATPDAELPGLVVHRADSDRHSTVLVRVDPVRLAARQRPGWQADPVGFEQLVMAYLQRPPQAAKGNPALAAAQPGPSAKAVTR